MWRTTLNETTKLTLELGDIVDNGENSIDIWDFDYPCHYDGEQKKAFERKIIDHYYFRQIGQETVGRWLRMFRAKVREIMPYYVDLYRTVEIMNSIEDPFGNVDVTETYQETRTSSTTGKTTGSTTATNTETASGSSEETKTTTFSENREHNFSDTPQGNIANVRTHISEGSIDENESSEDATLESSTNSTMSGNGSTSGTTETESSGTDTLTHTFNKKGNQGVNTYAHDMIEFRDTIINIDMMIIEELNELFLGVY